MPRFALRHVLASLALVWASTAAATSPDAVAQGLVARLRAATTPRQRDLLLASLDQHAATGSAAAAEVLARVFGKGLLGLPRAPDRARRYLEQAARLGSPAARRYLARLGPAPAPVKAVEIVMEADPPPPPDPTLVHRAGSGGLAAGPDSPLADLTRTRKLQIFTSPVCPPCRAYEPVVQEYCDARRDLQLELVDITTDAGRRLAEQEGIEATPTTLFLDDRGEALTRILGYRSPEELVDLLGPPGS